MECVSRFAMTPTAAYVLSPGQAVRGPAADLRISQGDRGGGSLLEWCEKPRRSRSFRATSTWASRNVTTQESDLTTQESDLVVLNKRKQPSNLLEEGTRPERLGEDRARYLQVCGNAGDE